MSSLAQSDQAWENFLDSCGIPVEMRKKYVNSFVKQRMKPHLLKDLGKEDLRELGVSALGDQLAIMRYVKQCDGTPPEFANSTTVNKSRRVYKTSNEVFIDEDEPMDQSIAPPLSRAPDRHDIYHIKMPTGNLPKTRDILEKHKELRDQGVIKRGVSGVRRSGVELRSISGASKIIQRKGTRPTTVMVQDTDISSSTGVIPLGTLRSDSISTKTTVVKDFSPNQRRMNAGQSVGKQEVLVRLNIPSARKPLTSFSQRRLVSYEDDSEGFGRTMVGGPRPIVGGSSIADRIQVLGANQPTGRTASMIALDGRPLGRRGPGARIDRPIITVAGRQITLGGTRAAGPSIRKGMSILERITVTK